MRKAFMLILAMFVWIVPTVAQDSARVDEAFIAGMEALIEAAIEKYNVPGSAVAFVQDGEIAYSAGFGVRDLENGDPVTPETLFRPGSTLKSATAMLVATLVDDGLLAWDTPVSEVLPGLQFPTEELTAELTIAEIMGHGTGLETSVIPYYWGQVSPEDVIAAQVEAEVSGERGESYAYNNDLFAVAGYAAAAAAGAEGDYLAAYAALMQERLFDPMDMATYAISSDPAAFSDNASASYNVSLILGLEVPDPTNGTIPTDGIAPAGGGVGSALDMANYLITQLNGGIAPDGTRVVSEENLLRTRQVQNPVPDESFTYPDFVTYKGYGMGWVTLEVGGVEVIWHNGSIDGFYTDMLMVPDANAGMVMMSNSVLGFAANQWMMLEFVNRLYDLQIATIEEEVDGMLDAQTQGMAMLNPLLADPTIDAGEVAEILGGYEKGWTVRVDDEDLLRLERPGISTVLVPFPSANNFIGVSDQLGLLVRFRPNEDGIQVMTIDLPSGTHGCIKVD